MDGICVCISAYGERYVFRQTDGVRSPGWLYSTDKVTNGVGWIIQVWKQNLLWHLWMCARRVLCGGRGAAAQHNVCNFVWEQEVMRNEPDGGDDNTGAKMWRQNNDGESANCLFTASPWRAVPLGRFSRKDDLLLPCECTSTTSIYHSFIQAGAVIITTSGPALWVHAVWKPLHCMCTGRINCLLCRFKLAVKSEWACFFSPLRR